MGFAQLIYSSPSSSSSSSLALLLRDAFHNLSMEKEAVTFHDLQRGLGKIVHISGILYVSADDLAPWLTNLTFLSNLRVIDGGRRLLIGYSSIDWLINHVFLLVDLGGPMGYTTSLGIIMNQHLEFLGLSSLLRIQTRALAVHVFRNPRLCYIQSIKILSLLPRTAPSSSSSLSSPVLTLAQQSTETAITQNRPEEDCGMLLLIRLINKVTDSAKWFLNINE